MKVIMCPCASPALPAARTRRRALDSVEAGELCWASKKKKRQRREARTAALEEAAHARHPHTRSAARLARVWPLRRFAGPLCIRLRRRHHLLCIVSVPLGGQVTRVPPPAPVVVRASDFDPSRRRPTLSSLLTSIFPPRSCNPSVRAAIQFLPAPASLPCSSLTHDRVASQRLSHTPCPKTVDCLLHAQFPARHTTPPPNSSTQALPQRRLYALPAAAPTTTTPTAAASPPPRSPRPARLADTTPLLLFPVQ